MNDTQVPRPQYGWCTHYCLHSAWISWLVSLDDERRAKVVAHFGGYCLSISEFTLAIFRHGWARVTTRTTEDLSDAWVGLELPVLMDMADGSQRTEWQRVLELHHSIVGLTPSEIVALGVIEMQSQVDELLGMKS